MDIRKIPQTPIQNFMIKHYCVSLILKTVVMHHVQCVVIGTILMGAESSLILREVHFGEIEVQTNRGMADSFMAQFVCFVDGVTHQEEDVSAVSYPVLPIPTLIRLSSQILVRYKLCTRLLNALNT